MDIKIKYCCGSQIFDKLGDAEKYKKSLKLNNDPNNDLYYQFPLGEGMSSHYKYRDNRPLVYRKKDEIIREFYDSMRNLFSQYGEDYEPESIAEIEVSKCKEAFICKISSFIHIIFKSKHKMLPANICDSIRENGLTECLCMSYGTSGGLHLDFASILVKKGTRIDMFLDDDFDDENVEYPFGKHDEQELVRVNSHDGSESEEDECTSLMDAQRASNEDQQEQVLALCEHTSLRDAPEGPSRQRRVDDF
jgi:hypothetical protein